MVYRNVAAALVGILGFCAAASLRASDDNATAEASPAIPVLSQEEAWARLPPAEVGQNAPLPAWARATVGSLPRTTAAMLELDWQHRAASPLGPVLAAKIRWTVANANHCEYIKAQAAADLARAGVAQIVIESLGTEVPADSADEQAVLEFARKLTVNANDVTDEQVAHLLSIYGEKQVVAMVLLVAYGNFQDRLLLALQTKTEAEGPLAPVEVRFVTGDAAVTVIAPERELPMEVDVPEVPEHVQDAQWLLLDFDDLQQNLSQQRERDGRIRVPTWDEVVAVAPPQQLPKHPVRIRWSLVCRGYQPQLAGGWSACMRTFAEESQQDRVFEESMFWVITRTIHCFY